MNEKNILLFCATFITVIISKAQTQQQWPYFNSCQNIKPLEIINHLNQPQYQPPVISSKKIDVAIDQRIKPIYWSTLLPSPIGETLKPITNNQNNIKLAKHYRPVTNSDDYYTKLLLDYIKGINTAEHVNHNAENPLVNKLRSNEGVKDVTGKNKENVNEHKKQHHFLRKQIQDANLNLENQDKRPNKKNDHYKNEVNNKDSRSVSKNCKQVSRKNSKAVPKSMPRNRHCLSNPPKKYNHLEQEECECRDIKPHRRKKDNGNCLRQVDSDIMEPANEISHTNTRSNFDENCAGVNDILNINLEYSDCDCECIRNSRNNDKTKETPKKSYDVSNNFPKDYLNLVYNLLQYQNSGYFYPESNCFFPYNFDYLYPFSQPKNTKCSKKGSNKNNNSKASEKAKKDPNKKKVSKNRKKSKDKIKDCNTVIELAPTIMTINRNGEDPDTDLVKANDDSNIDSVEYAAISFPLDELSTPSDFLGTGKIFKLNPTDENAKTDEDSSEVTNESDQEYSVENTLTVHENPYTESEELIIPLLPNGGYFWDDYYPDFTLDNGAYITSSEEEEWVNFHKYFYSNDGGANKEILKRNLYKKSKIKPDLTKYSQARPFTRISGIASPNIEMKLNPSSLNCPDFTTRIVNKEDIPSYKDLLLENNISVENNNNRPTHNNYKIQDIETIYAPSKVRNYSFKTEIEHINESSEESLENKIFVREGDLTVIYSAPFNNNN